MDYKEFVKGMSNDYDWLTGFIESEEAKGNHIDFDDESDYGYLTIIPGDNAVARTVEFDGLMVDIDYDEQIAGIEFPPGRVA